MSAYALDTSHSKRGRAGASLALAAGLLSAVLALELALSSVAAAAQAADPASLSKTVPPTVTKVIGTPAEASTEAMAEVGTDVPFRLEGTLPSDYEEYRSYAYAFVDEADDGLVPDAMTVRVSLVNAQGDVQSISAGAYALSLEGRTLRLSFANLKESIPDARYGDRIRLDYEARLVPGSLTCGFGNANRNVAYVEYSPDPETNGLASTPHAEASLFCLALNVTKRDEHTGEPLAGARLALRRADGLWLATDGSWTSDANAAGRTTDSDGRASFMGLAAGTYTLAELDPPEGYQAVRDEIAVVLSADLQNHELTASLQSEEARLEGVDADSGTLDVSVLDSVAPTVGVGPRAERLLRLPFTGDRQDAPPVVLVFVGMASAVVAATLRGSHRKARKDVTRHG